MVGIGIAGTSWLMILLGFGPIRDSIQIRRTTGRSIGIEARLHSKARVWSNTTDTALKDRMSRTHHHSTLAWIHTTKVRPSHAPGCQVTSKITRAVMCMKARKGVINRRPTIIPRFVHIHGRYGWLLSIIKRSVSLLQRWDILNSCIHIRECLLRGSGCRGVPFISYGSEVKCFGKVGKFCR